MPRLINSRTLRQLALTIDAVLTLSRHPRGGLFLVVAAFLILALPAASRADLANPHGVAVIVGNKSYRNERVPEVAYAHRDAEAFRRYVIDVLGFDPNRVFDLRDATQAEMFTWFGNRDSHEGRLWRYLHPRHGSDVVVFYSGHGVPGLKDRRGYLLPSDAEPDTPEINGYPIDLLYANLGKPREAKTVRVFLDACFSGDSDRGMLVRSASPVFVQASLPEASGEKLTVLSASSGTEVASWDEKARHGMFTHHLLDALYGKGDLDGDGDVTAAEAKTYLDDTMTIAARVEFGRHQNASLNGLAGAVLARVGKGGGFPPRPALEGEGAAPGGAEEAKAVPAPGSVETAESVEAALGLTFKERVLVQHGLNSLGEDVGRADGVFGRRTRAGVRSYQKKKGLSETGHLTGELRDALVALGEAHAKERKQEAVAGRERERNAEERRKAEETQQSAVTEESEPGTPVADQGEYLYLACNRLKQLRTAPVSAADVVTRDICAENERLANLVATAGRVLEENRASSAKLRVRITNNEEKTGEIDALQRRIQSNVEVLNGVIANLNERRTQYAEVAGKLDYEGEDTAALRRQVREMSEQIDLLVEYRTALEKELD